MKFLLLCLLLIAHPAWSKDLSSAYLKGKEITLLSQVRAIQQYKVLIIPGVLAQSFLKNSDNQIKLNAVFSDAFSEQIMLMERLKIDYEFLQLETENPPEVNASIIIEAIESSPKEVLIYSHSKGGLDTLEAIRQKPSVLSKIQGWASIQSPFWGAPVASGFNNNEILRDSGDSLFEFMGGSAEGMSSLTVEKRVEYMNRAEINSLIETVKARTHFVNFATYKSNSFGYDTPLEFFRNFTNQKAGNNDGVVPVTSALMKDHGLDVDFILEREVDHLMTMTRYYLLPQTYNIKAHTMSVLKLLL